MTFQHKQSLLEEFDLRFTEMLYHNDLSFRLAKQRDLIRILDNMIQEQIKDLPISMNDSEKFSRLRKEFIDDARENQFESEIYETQNTLIIEMLQKID